jgi:predicted nucleic acid-binding protein
MATMRPGSGERVDWNGGGLPYVPWDLLIAGTALSSGDNLATNNAREFSGIKGLRLADREAA